VPSPSSVDAASNATFVIYKGIGCGERFLNNLHNGVLPSPSDSPYESFTFAYNSPGGLLMIDLHRVIHVLSVNSYSWHATTRAPQAYTLYGRVHEPAIEERYALNDTVSPSQLLENGWTKICDVDTRPSNESDYGGQYGVSIQNPSAGSLGPIRYLLFNILPIKKKNLYFENTVFSEIDVVSTTLSDPEIPPRRHYEAPNGSIINLDAQTLVPTTNSSALSDAKLLMKPTDCRGEFYPASNPCVSGEPFSFASTSEGGRLLIDLGEPKDMFRFTSFSGDPQRYCLYGSIGPQGGAVFNRFPDLFVDPAKVGYHYIATVDTRKGNLQSQPGEKLVANVTKKDSTSFGMMQYILLDVSPYRENGQRVNTKYFCFDVGVSNNLTQ